MAVVLYHMGISASGYLGVDAFFVINGFLIVPKVVRDIANGQFRYFAFLEKRTGRLFPLAVLAAALSLLAGYYGMVPDDYENLAQSVVATNIFSNNILASITTRNYWETVNEFKPLMHTWYLGILFEFYLFFPLVVMAVKRLSKKMGFGFDKYAVITLLALSTLSVLLYLNPSVSTGDRFYLLPYRFFELSFGGLAGMWIADHRQGRLYRHGALSGACFAILSLILFVGAFQIGEQPVGYNLDSGAAYTGDYFIPQNILLLTTVVLTLFFLVSENTQSCLVSWFQKAGGGDILHPRNHQLQHLHLASADTCILSLLHFDRPFAAFRSRLCHRSTHTVIHYLSLDRTESQIMPANENRTSAGLCPDQRSCLGSLSACRGSTRHSGTICSERQRVQKHVCRIQ